MELDEYQNRAMATCMESCENHAYMLLGLIGEIGELYGKLAKAIRREELEFSDNRLLGGLTEKEYDTLKAEVGDCAWFIAGICHIAGWTLEEICQENLAKLASRKARGVISGNGDNR